MTVTKAEAVLDPADPTAWAEHDFDLLLSMPIGDVREAQREALALRFASLRPSVAALDKLATGEGIDEIESLESALPVFFDHRVYKTYPLSLVDKGRFDRLTAWLQRLTTHDLSSVPLDGVDSIDSWLTRLDDHGMLIGHSTGTTGKLSFVPRSRTEWPAWQNAYFSGRAAATGIDFRVEKVPVFQPMYRSGHHMMAKMNALFAGASAGGEEYRHVLYDYPISSDLLSLAGRFRGAAQRGEVDELSIDPDTMKMYEEFVERNANREQDLEAWFTKLAEEYRGQRVHISGTVPDLVRLALKGRDRGVACDFGPGTTVFMGGGTKGFQDAPDDWEALVADFFGVEDIVSMYGMSEVMGVAPRCREGFFHFPPYAVPLMLDADARPLPTEGVQAGRIALFDLLAESYWGGFITGDHVTMHWDSDCACGWGGPRIEREITRFAEMEGGDDKITCAGTQEALDEFMDYVGAI